MTCPAADDHSKCCKEPLSLKPKLENVSRLQSAIKHEKDVIKRKFHSMSLASLASVFSRTDEPSCSTNESTSLLKTLLLVSAATVAIIAVVRGMSSSQWTLMLPQLISIKIKLEICIERWTPLERGYFFCNKDNRVLQNTATSNRWFTYVCTFTTLYS